MTYNAVKASEISLAKSMAQQLAADNIRVNSVAPGSISFPGGTSLSQHKCANDNGFFLHKPCNQVSRMGLLDLSPL